VPTPAPPRDGSGFGTAGALLGMAAVVLPCLSWLTVRLGTGPAAGVVALVLLLAGLPVAVLAVVLSAVGLSPRRAGRGAAATGLVLAGFVLAVWLVGFAVPLTRL
jgi:apolipoprotein N-acyltransferase